MASKWEKDIVNSHRNVNHLPMKKRPEELSTLADQINEKLLKNNIQQPDYAVDFTSKTFGPIKLKYLKDDQYSPKDIVNFFSALDYVGILHVSVKPGNYVDDDSFLTVFLKPNTYELPISLFWFCLPQDIRNKFKNN